MTDPKQNPKGKNGADSEDFAETELSSISSRNWEEPSAQTRGKSAGYRENRSASPLAILGLILGILALGGLLLIGPRLKYQVDSLNTDMELLSTTLSSVEKKMSEMDHSVKGLHNQFGSLEKTMTILELRRMLQTIENISLNVPEVNFEKASQIQKNIESLLSDLGSEVDTSGPEDSLDKTEVIEEETPAPPVSETAPSEIKPAPPTEGTPPPPAPEAAPETPQPPQGHRTDISGHDSPIEIPAAPSGENKDFGKIELHHE